MSKLRTAISLLANCEFTRFHSRLRFNLCKLRLAYARRSPFIYRLTGIPFVCNPGIPDSEEYYLTGAIDHIELKVLWRWLQAGDIFIDIGANLGIYTFAAVHFLRGRGTVFAIEAAPELVTNLQKSADMLGAHNLNLIQCVVGDANKESVFYTAPLGQSTGEQSLCPDPARSTDYMPRRLKMRTLSDIATEYPAFASPAAVKIDIEGAEVMALSAVPPTWFSATGPLWIVEINPSALVRIGTSCAALVRYFHGNIFECWLLPHFALTGERILPPRPLMAEEKFTDAWFYNLIAVPVNTNQSSRYKRINPVLSAAQHTSTSS